MRVRCSNGSAAAVAVGGIDAGEWSHVGAAGTPSNSSMARLGSTGPAGSANDLSIGEVAMPKPITVLIAGATGQQGGAVMSVSRLVDGRAGAFFEVFPVSASRVL